MVVVSRVSSVLYNGHLYCRSCTVLVDLIVRTQYHCANVICYFMYHYLFIEKAMVYYYHISLALLLHIVFLIQCVFILLVAPNVPCCFLSLHWCCCCVLFSVTTLVLLLCTVFCHYTGVVAVYCFQQFVAVTSAHCWCSL